MIFADRNEAGRLIAERLLEREIINPIVVAIPRGGIPVALLTIELVAMWVCKY